MHRGALLAAGLLSVSVRAGLTADERVRNVESFDYVWKTIRDKHWSLPSDVNWQGVRDELRPKVEAATSTTAARAVMLDMIGRLKQSHFAIIPGDLSDVLGGAFKSGGTGDGDPGLDVRIIHEEPVVVSVEKGSPAEQAGVRPGWVIRKIDSAEIAPTLKKASAGIVEGQMRGLILSRLVLFAMQRPPGSAIKLEFLDEANRAVAKSIGIIPPRGKPAKFGYLPEQHVWFESRNAGNIGYARWNVFLDPAGLMPQFGEAVRNCSTCDGFIIDLRGNPGGIGVMAMGIAGWFVSKPDQKLGVMKTRDNELKFVIFPRSQVFANSLAIVVDESTASTSEIFAEGLKDLGRARIFGSRTAGAALPSVFERLPNGDGFQYAIANYISANGKPLEGFGVTPDVEIDLTREALLAGHDPALEAAFAWIRNQRKAN
jgi:carboxyl-terminal processing protease